MGNELVQNETGTRLQTRAFTTAARVSTSFTREKVTVKVLNHIPIPREYY